MSNLTPEVWFVYDGACPLCTFGSNHWRVQEAVGTLHILDARENRMHPLLQEINARKINLDEGMVIKFQDNYYHGVDALHVMALLGTRVGWFNRMNAHLFRSRRISRLCYPFMRAARRIALVLKGAPLIHNLAPEN
jgi:predicted DCC family thiol-disulfide oxidoreductase YuxK